MINIIMHNEFWSGHQDASEFNQWVAEKEKIPTPKFCRTEEKYGYFNFWISYDGIYWINTYCGRLGEHD